MMNKTLIILSLTLLASCGPSSEEIRQAEMEQQRIEQEANKKLAQEKANRIAAVTCSIMGETKNIDGAIRVREINDAREKIGGEPFLSGDDAIKEAFGYGLCEELVLNENYDEIIKPLRDATQERERIAAEKQLIAEEKRAEENRIAVEKRAEENRIAEEKRVEENRIAVEKRAEENRITEEKRVEENRIAVEKQRMADSKPTVKETFHSNGKLRHRVNYQSKTDGGKKDGLDELYLDNGQLFIKQNYKDGVLHGLSEFFDDSGQLKSTRCWQMGKLAGVPYCEK